MILVDGREADAVPVDDRGLAYGDGMFETLCVHRGCLPLMNYHLERLFTGLHTLDFPQISRQVLIDELEHAARRSGDDIVKLIVTRGSGGRGYAPPENTEPRRIIVTSAASASLAEWRRAGVVLRHCATVLDGPQRLAGLKHLNRLPQVLARAEWRDAEIHEGLMRDAQGHVTEGTMSNLFIIDGAGVLMTPPIGAGGVRGVMRRLVLELATARGLDCREASLDDAKIETAGEIFITNSIIGICPVRRIENTAYGIGTMTRLLQADVENELERRACSDA